MAHNEIRFYLDENLSPEIAAQLQLRGLDVIRGPLRDSDCNHLQRAAESGHVLCTQDDDFNRMHEEGIDHAGIIKGHTAKHSIGTWVRFLLLIHSVYTADETRNSVEFVFETD